MPRWLSVPSLFTLSRLFLTPLIVWAIIRQRHGLAIAVFAAAAFTDVVDGLLARRFGWITRTGALLDPVTDKLLLNSVYVALAAISKIPRWFVVVVFSRDLFILAAAGALILFTDIRKFPPSGWGKLSTLFQVLYGLVTMIGNVVPGPVATQIARVFLWPAAAATIWSWIHYTWRGWQMFRGPLNSSSGR